MKPFFNPPNPFDAAAQMAELTLWGHNDPTPAPDWVRSFIGTHWFDFVSQTPENRSHYPAQADYESPLFHPQALRYLLSTRGRIIHPSEENFEPWRVELARFSVPHAYVGIVHSFEQYIAAADLAGWTSATQYPFADIDAGVSGTWLFCLSPFDGSALPWLSMLNPPPERPGQHYSDMPEFSGIWYPFGNDAQNIRLTIPGGFSLRVFWECGALDVRPAVAAALKGSIQGIYSQRGLDVTRGQWQ